MKRPSKGATIIGITLLILIIGIIGGTVTVKNIVDHKKQEEREEMMREVNKHEDAIYDFIHNQDKYQRVNSIQINDKTVKHNPMGGIDVDGTVNNNKDLSWNINIDRDSESGEIIAVNAANSSKLDDLFNEDNYNGK
ncbi:DUF1310 family protein [Furfurilactobacillus sp. WILCCON 0119]